MSKSKTEEIFGLFGSSNLCNHVKSFSIPISSFSFKREHSSKVCMCDILSVILWFYRMVFLPSTHAFFTLASVKR
ncbi:hypothetical protein CDL12_08140 [Handroanthus impetiginosus]|uniref:Uncharacterized protein n=1 Tax=Handroanthus impetiginosus TaxID=429701 RepID=A0A2G9HNQ4_9LAMI|nr:hypothetical protein CDL12_08140 [Handroanthus impetiginosus]